MSYHSNLYSLYRNYYYQLNIPIWEKEHFLKLIIYVGENLVCDKDRIIQNENFRRFLLLSVAYDIIIVGFFLPCQSCPLWCNGKISQFVI